MTGKGVRWGRDSVGRSAPAFVAASTTALPPLTCTARGRRHLRLFGCCEAGQLWAVCFEACAGRRVRRLCLPAVPVLRAVFACCHLCLPCPLPSSTSCPRSVCFAPVQFALFACTLFISMCARITVVRASSLLSGPAVCRLQDCPVGSCNTGLQWRPVHRVHFDLPFSLQSP